MEHYGDMMASAGIVVYIVLALFVFLLAWGAYKFFKRKGNKTEEQLPNDSYEEISENIIEVKSHGQGEVKIGSGKYQCICFRNIDGVNAIDFTKINKPIGELYQFDTSCPSSGNGYIVKQEGRGEIVDYDPRQEGYNIQNSPEYAWFAISWDICKRVFFIPVQWYKSSSVWFAAAMLVITFIVSLAIIG